MLNPTGPQFFENLSREAMQKALDDLHVQHIELEVQNAELRRIQEKLDLEFARYFDLYNLAPVGYCILNAKGRLTEVNLTLICLLKIDKNKILSWPISHFIHEEDQHYFLKLRSQILKPLAQTETELAIQKTVLTCELRMIKSDGTLFWAQLQGQLSQTSDSTNAEIQLMISDISEIRKLQDLQRENAANYRTILDSIPDPLFEFGLDGYCYAYHSPNSHSMFNPAEEILGKNVVDILPPAAANVILSALQEAHEIGFSNGKQFQMQVPAGNIWMELNVSRKASDPNQPRFIVLRREISARKQALLDLQIAMEGATSVALAKSEFLTSMSHEIRTPMNGVLGLTQLLEETSLSSEQSELVETIKSSGSLLLILLNDILDYSKMESGKLDIECLPFSIQNLLTEIQRSMYIATRAKDIAFEIHISDQVPSLLVSDPSRLRQIIFNLVGNAVKFTDKGGITLTVDWNEKGFRLAVHDTGMGIPRNKQNLIFQRFSQAEASTARKYGGSGLGLAISKRLVELMGGKIGLVSEVGYGSTFWFTLPMERASEPINKESQEIESHSIQQNRTQSPLDFSQFRILLVEDNLVNQMVASGMLKKLGCPFDLAQNGIEAVAKSMQNPYALILMDCEMPEMDGYTATCEIRRLEAEALDAQGQPKMHRSIVALTANVMPDDKAKCLACGMDGFLPKPLLKESLLRVLEATILSP